MTTKHWKLIFWATAIAAVILWLGGGRLSPTVEQPTAISATQTERTKRQGEEDTQLAARRAAYVDERPAVMAKAKKLSAARKYQELADLGFEYIWAQDQELNALADTARDQLTQIAMAKSRAERKKLGVRIGMSEQDVLESNWGKPNDINTTTTASHVRQQWVYSYKGYLYFTDGILTSIQN